MKTKVPERRNSVKEIKPSSLSQEGQVALLRTMLAGHKVFGRCRGNFGDLPFDEFLGRDKKTSPSFVRNAFDKWAVDQRVMLNMLACLKRDGHTFAFEELKKALCGSYTMIGENIPLDQTESGVVIMINPIKTLLIIRWLYTSRIEDIEHWVTHGRGIEDRGQCGSLTPKIQKLAPECIEKLLDKATRRYRFNPMEVLKNDAYERLRKIFCADSILPLFVDKRSTDSFYSEGFAAALLIKDVDLSKVLSVFEREEQDSMATWSFNYPKIDSGKIRRAWGSYSDMWIGFHPEKEHKLWRRRWPNFVSKGVSNGLGAVILDNDMLQMEFSGEEDKRRYSSIVGIYPLYCEGDLMEKRIVIGLPYSPIL